MNKEKIAAIVPALNEEKTIGAVLKVVIQSKQFDEVILVDDGSKDKTSQIGKKLGVRVLTLQKNIGKASAMRKGIEATDAEIVAFFDADLINFSTQHIFSLIGPVLKNEAAMCIGIRDRWWGLPKMIAKKFPFMLAIGGERVIRSYILKDIPEKFIHNLSDTMVINYYCKFNKLPIKFVDLKGLNIVVKEKKWGLFKGLIARFNMIVELIKIRIMISLHKKDFKIKN